MGIDWVTQCAPSWERGWDRGLAELSCPNLFTNLAPELELTFRARPRPGFEFRVGGMHQLRLSDGAVLVLEEKGIAVVGDGKDAPPRVLKTLRDQGCGVGLGVVRQVYPFTHSAEIALL